MDRENIIVRKKLIGIGIVLAVIAVAGYTYSNVVKTESDSTSNSSVVMICTLGAVNAAVEVQVTNDSASCSTDEQALASFGLSWYSIDSLASPGANTSDDETMYQVCSLAKNDSTITVMDSGSAFYGTEICSSEEQSGWTNT